MFVLFFFEISEGWQSVMEISVNSDRLQIRGLLDSLQLYHSFAICLHYLAIDTGEAIIVSRSQNCPPSAMVLAAVAKLDMTLLPLLLSSYFACVFSSSI